MTTTAAQDEFNELLRDKNTHHRHFEDRQNDSDHSDAESDHASDYLERVDTDDELDLPLDMRSNYYLPAMRSQANTGPKGVIADAYAFEQAKKDRSFSRRSNSPPSSYSVSAYHEDKFQSDEDSFMKKWREEKLRELRNASQRMRSRTRSPRGQYGSMKTVDILGFSDNIEQAPRNVVVAVFVYDDRSTVSAEVESYMHEIARRNPATQFLKLHYDEAELGDVGMPALLSYKNNEELSILLPLTDVLKGSELSVISLEKGFRKERIIPGIS